MFAQSNLPACQGSDATRWSNCVGTFTFANGDKYVGEYKDGKLNGQGTFTFANGDKYVGEYKDDRRNGQGTVAYADGDRYVGEYKDGKRNGQGTYIYADGDRHVGEYRDDLFHGKGTYTSYSGAKYVGDYKDGTYHGQGTYTYFDGEKYVGEWKDGNYSGKGTKYASNGSVINQGIYANDKFIGSAPVQQANTPNTEIERLRAEAEESKRLLAQAEDQKRIQTQLAETRQRELQEQLKITQQQSSSAISQSTISASKERRVALVIGNATYKINPLKNPVNDSTDMARSLRSVGFDVIEANNTTLAQMREVTRRFADKLGSSDVGLVYYSGHGVEVKGKNYLIPVNADIKREYEVVDQAFDASQFLEMMDNIRGPNNKRVNILIVDACRNNELQRSWRSTNNGLARMDAPGGTFISFATAPGRVAADGAGRNSPYTKHLLQALKQPNVPIEQVFKVVRRNVMEETKGEQIPWENSSLVGDFYFTVQK